MVCGSFLLWFFGENEKPRRKGQGVLVSDVNVRPDYYSAGLLRLLRLLAHERTLVSCVLRHAFKTFTHQRRRELRHWDAPGLGSMVKNSPTSTFVFNAAVVPHGMQSSPGPRRCWPSIAEPVRHRQWHPSLDIRGRPLPAAP